MCRKMFKKANNKRFLAVLLITILSLLPLATGFADAEGSEAPKHKDEKYYTSLGDSVASDTTQGDHVDRFYKYLRKNNDKKFNLEKRAEPGKTSTELYEELEGLNEVEMEIFENTQVFTISIGSNNLLGPIKEAVAEGVNVVGFSGSEWTTEQLVEALVFKYGLNPYGPDFEADLMAAVKTELEALMGNTGLVAALGEGVSDFADDWPEIMNEIEMLAPDAKVYVTTIYNPLPSSDTAGIGDVYSNFYTALESYIIGMNDVITGYQLLYGYEIIDAHDMNLKAPLTDFLDFNKPDFFNPHLNLYGHKAIYKELKAAYKEL